MSIILGFLGGLPHFSSSLYISMYCGGALLNKRFFIKIYVSDSFSQVTLGTIPNTRVVATGYKGFIVTATVHVNTLTIGYEDTCFWSYSRSYYFVRERRGCYSLATPPEFNISCQYSGSHNYDSKFTFLQPLNATIYIYLRCIYSSADSLTITVKSKITFC